MRAPKALEVSLLAYHDNNFVNPHMLAATPGFEATSAKSLPVSRDLKIVPTIFV